MKARLKKEQIIDAVSSFNQWKNDSRIGAVANLYPKNSEMARKLKELRKLIGVVDFNIWVDAHTITGKDITKKDAK